jgi:CubicO group peptidase (beta-lactamase class C family)
MSGKWALPVLFTLCAKMELTSYLSPQKLLTSGVLAILAISIGIPGIATCSPLETPPDTFLEDIRENHHLPGLVAARIKSRHDTHQITISRAVVGVRKFGDPTKITPHDTFHLGSLTKAMTSTLLTILMRDRGNNLTWSTTVPEAFPHLTSIILPEHNNTTLAMLAAHRAGINDTASILRDLPLWLALENKTYTPVEGRRLVAKSAFSTPPITVPGSNYLYSNIGYMLLGHLIDTYPWRHPYPHTNTPTNTSYESLLRSRLWAPLDIPPGGCGFGPAPESSPSSVDNPWPHVTGNPDPVPLPSNADLSPAIAPAGTVHCTVDSYAQFLGLHLDAFFGRTPIRGALLPSSAFKVLHTPYQVLTGAPLIGGAGDIYTSGGWLLVPDDGVRGRYLLHDGTNGGNYAWAIVAGGATGRGEAYFIGTNVGSAEEAMVEVSEGLFEGKLEF